MEHQEETLLKVEHLCQYFKMGPGRELKAVDDVSFDIKKGEVFGLVGESGCGKTTTGRSIIKLYDITSGNVYFKGQRICAGTRSYKEAIRAARTAYREKIAALDKQKKEEVEQGADRAQAEALNKKLRAEAEEQYRTAVLENRKLIASAKHDQKFCDKDHAEKVVASIKEEREKALAACSSDEERKKVEKDYKTRLRVASHERIVNRIQMIFQDPIASLNPRMTVRDIIAEGLIIHGIKDKDYIDEKVYNILEKVGLVREHAGRYPHEFSGGQRQRIGIARSVIMEPELIIADEPVSALDVSIQAQVINLLNDLRSELGRPHRRHVLRQDGRACALRRAVRAPAAPLHAFAPFRHPAARSAVREAAPPYHLQPARRARLFRRRPYDAGDHAGALHLLQRRGVRKVQGRARPLI